MKNTSSQPAEPEFPKGVGAPARRALIAAGFNRLEDLNGQSAAALLGLHGMGPKAVGILRAALVEKGMSLRD